MKSAQLAQRDAELAAAKQEVATRLAAHQELARVRPALYLPPLHCKTWGHFQASQQQKHARWCLVKSGNGALLKKLCDLQVATNRSHELQEQFGRTTIDLHAAKAQITELQTNLAGKCDEVNKDKRALAALQNTHRASVKASIHFAQYTLLYPHIPPPHPPPPSTPSTLAAMILMAHNDLWLIVAVLASHATFVPLQIKCYSMITNLKLHC